MLSIGTFSAVCRVTGKTLRHYDQIGLLKPEFTDPVTGYRYYSQEQVETMLLIKAYKRYGFSLKEIRALLECQEEALPEKLNQQKQKLERRMEELRQAFAELERHLASLERKEENMREQETICLAESGTWAVVALRQRMGVQEILGNLKKLEEQARGKGILLTGARGAVYHDQEFCHDSTDMELVAEVKDPAQADRILSVGLCARMVYRGPLSRLSEGYGALIKWICENGYEVDKSPVEWYREGETEIWFPIRSAQQS